MEKKKFIINGKKFSDMTGFYNEVQLVLTKKFMGFGKNLDAFDDILYGGFGKFDENEEIVLIWKNFDKSRKELPKTLLENLIKIIKSHDKIDLV